MAAKIEIPPPLNVPWIDPATGTVHYEWVKYLEYYGRVPDDTLGTLQLAVVLTDLTLDETHSVLLVDPTGLASGTITITLPADPSDVFKGDRSRVYHVVNTGLSGLTVIIDAGSNEIDGNSTVTLAAGDARTIATDGSNWFTVNLQSKFLADLEAVVSVSSGLVVTGRVSATGKGTFSGGLQLGAASKSADFDIANETACVFFIDDSTGNITATLPAGNSVGNGTIFMFWRIGSSGNTITIQRCTACASDTINGGTSVTISTTQYEALGVIKGAGTFDWYVFKPFS